MSQECHRESVLPASIPLAGRTGVAIHPSWIASSLRFSQ
jgi:hypothetical protein